MSAMGQRSHNAARKFTCKKSYSGSLHAHMANRERGFRRFSNESWIVANWNLPTAVGLKEHDIK